MGPFGAALYFGRQGDKVTVARQAIIFVSGWILDCVLVYRVYILFGNSKLIALMPGIFLVGTMGLSFRSPLLNRQPLTSLCLLQLLA
jgi:hypothetical protein